MSDRDTASVAAAIETLETSYSYETTRWDAAYAQLRSLEREFEHQLRPYSWIGVCCLALGITWLLAVLVWWSSRTIVLSFLFDNLLLDWLVWTTLISAPAVIIPFGSWLALHVAARRHPLLLLKPRIERAIGRFRSFAAEPNRDDA